MSWTHEHSWRLEAPPARVFAVLTDPAELTTWFAEHVDVSLASGGRYRFWGRHTLGAPSREEAGQTMTRLEPGRALGFTWLLHGVPTTVDLALAADGEATRLTLHHLVEGELPLPRPKEPIDDHWRLGFGNLAAHKVDGRDVEGGPTKILEFIPNEKLVLDWPDWRGDKSVAGQRITFQLEAEGSGTKLTFVHSGFDRTTDIGDYPFGWVYFIGKLGDGFKAALVISHSR